MVSVSAIIERETGQTVTDETPLGKLDMDSLEFIELLGTIEREFNVCIPNAAYARLETVGDITRGLSSESSGKGEFMRKQRHPGLPAGTSEHGLG